MPLSLTSLRVLLSSRARQVCDAIGWRRIAVISTDDDAGRSFSDVLLRSIADFTARDATATNLTQQTGVGQTDLVAYEASTVMLPFEASSTATSVIGQMLDQLYTAGMRVFIMHGGERAAEIMQLAHARGMVGTGPDGIVRQWTGDFCNDKMAAQFQDEPEALFGTFCSVPPEPRTQPDLSAVNPQAVAFEQRLQAAYPALFPASGHITHLEVATGAALYAFVGLWGKTFANAGLPNTAASFFSQVQNASSPFVIVQPDGTSLPILADGDTFEPYVDTVNWFVESRSFVRTKSINLLTGAVTLTSRPWLSATGTNSYPKDRDRIYISGDVLPQTLDGKMVVLAFMIVVLGAWTALILLEQALSFWSRGIWAHALGWVALAALAFGACSVWSNTLMVLAAVTLDVDAHIYLVLWSSVVTALYPVALTFISFALCIHSVQGGLKPAANVNVNEVSDLTGNSSTNGSQNQSVHSSGRQSGVSSHLKILRSALRKRFHHLRESMMELANRDGVKLVVASLLLSLLFVTHSALVNAVSISCKADLAIPARSIVGAVFFAWVFNIPSLTMYFHVTRSGWRYLSPFLLSASLLGSFFILTQGAVWTYVKERAINTAGKVVANSSLAAVIVAACAVVCVALMAFNVNRLRQSRNTLDKMLTLVATQVRGLELDIEHEKEVAVALKEQGLFFRRSLEVINLCRPLWRPYAIAIALADPILPESLTAAAKLVVTTGALQPLETGRLQAAGGTAAAMAVPRGSLRPAAAAAAAASKKSQGVGAREDSEEKEPASGRRLLEAAEAGFEDSHLTALPGAVVTAPTSHPHVHRRGLSVSLDAMGSTTAAAGLARASAGAATAAAPAKGGFKQGGSVATSDAAMGGHAANTKGAVSKQEGTSKTPATISDFHRIHAHKQEKQLSALLKEISELNLDAPAASRAVADIRLPQILSHPVTIELMKDALAKNLSPENIALWIDIQRYRSLENGSIRKAVADEILQTFIISGATFEVNLSSFMKNYVQSQSHSSGHTRAQLDE